MWASPERCKVPGRELACAAHPAGEPVTGLEVWQSISHEGHIKRYNI